MKQWVSNEYGHCKKIKDQSFNLRRHFMWKRILCYDNVWCNLICFILLCNNIFYIFINALIIRPTFIWYIINILTSISLISNAKILIISVLHNKWISPNTYLSAHVHEKEDKCSHRNLCTPNIHNNEKQYKSYIKNKTLLALFNTIAHFYSDVIQSVSIRKNVELYVIWLSR